MKYYLRGLGLGIVVTAIIMGVAASRGRNMTDAEIIARAKQLGMTENTVLTDNAGRDDAADDGQTAAVSDENALDGNESENDAAGSPAGNDTTGNRLADENPGQDDGEALTADTDRENRDSTVSEGTDASGEQNAAAKPDDSENEDLEEADTQRTSKSVVIVIGSGDGSYAASKKLEDAGAIASAADFDTFLCQNGYDKKIRTGTYTIPANASEEQMARIITGAE